MSGEAGDESGDAGGVLSSLLSSSLLSSLLVSIVIIAGASGVVGASGAVLLAPNVLMIVSINRRVYNATNCLSAELIIILATSGHSLLNCSMMTAKSPDDCEI